MDTQTTVYARAVHAQEYSEIDTSPSRLCDFQAPIRMQRLVTNETRKQANDAMSYFRLGNQRISCSQVWLGPFQADAEALWDQRTDPSSDSAQGTRQLHLLGRQSRNVVITACKLTVHRVTVGGGLI